MMIDSRLKSVYDGRAETTTEERALVEQFAVSLGPDGAAAVLDGACTIIYMYVQWLRMACEDHDKDALEEVVPSLVTTMRQMPRSIRPEAIPTMAGLLVAAGIGLSPNLWRRQYGQWTEAEMNALEATAFLLAERINRLTGDREFATRLIADALSAPEAD